MNTQNAADKRNDKIENLKTRPLEVRKNELSFLDGSTTSLFTDNKKNMHCPTKKGAAKAIRIQYALWRVIPRMFTRMGGM